MKSTVLSKDDFVKQIKEMEKVYDFYDEFNSFFRNHNIDGYLFFPDSVDVSIYLLEVIFDDKGHWISYWMNELNFGKKYETGMICDEDGRDIILKTPEDLYEFLVVNMQYHIDTEVNGILC